MNCPNCGTPMTDSNVCTRCGSKLNSEASSSTPYAAQNGYNTYSNGKKNHSGSETAALVTAIIVSVVSVFAAFVIFIVSMTNFYKEMKEFQSNVEDEFGKYNFGIYEESDFETVTDNVWVDFKDDLLSFSDGRVETEYSLNLKEAFRGEAAAKLLEGQALPPLEKNQEFFVVHFELKINRQKDNALVLFPFYPQASSENDAVPILPMILDYKNKNKLVGNNEMEATDLWCAYTIDKGFYNPKIYWQGDDKKVMFNYTKTCVTNAEYVEAGGALESQDVPSNE